MSEIGKTAASRSHLQFCLNRVFVRPCSSLHADGGKSGWVESGTATVFQLQSLYFLTVQFPPCCAWVDGMLQRHGQCNYTAGREIFHPDGAQTEPLVTHSFRVLPLTQILRMTHLELNSVSSVNHSVPSSKNIQIHTFTDNIVRATVSQMWLYAQIIVSFFIISWHYVSSWD